MPLPTCTSIVLFRLSCLKLFQKPSGGSKLVHKLSKDSNLSQELFLMLTFFLFRFKRLRQGTVTSFKAAHFLQWFSPHANFEKTKEILLKTSSIFLNTNMYLKVECLLKIGNLWNQATEIYWYCQWNFFKSMLENCNWSKAYVVVLTLLKSRGFKINLIP